MGPKARKKQGFLSLFLAILFVLTWAWQGAHFHEDDADKHLESPCVLCQLAPQTEQGLSTVSPLASPMQGFSSGLSRWASHYSPTLTLHFTNIRGPPLNV